jgi:site-specific recombinase XerD
LELKDGRASLYLEYYLGRSETPVLDENGEQVLYTSGVMKGKPKFHVKHTRKKENLNLYIWAHPRSQQERLQNKNTLQLAEKIRFEREQQFLEDREGYRLKKDKETNFLAYFKEKCESERFTYYVRKSVVQTYNRFIRFLRETPRYSKYDKFLHMETLTPELVLKFSEFLRANGKGEGPNKMYHYFKRIVLDAMEDGLIRTNPCKGIVVKHDRQQLTKEILSPDEIKKLIATRYEEENREVQRAFVFSLFTGVRWCDVKLMTHGNVDMTTRTLRFNQKKVDGRSAHSAVVFPLSDDLVSLIGEPSQPYDPKELIFKIPNYSTCNKHLKRWIRAAGINKWISWHCARHSFAVNVLDKGANIKTVSTLMGHCGISTTEKYLHVLDKQKMEAVDSLGSIGFVMQ